MLGFAMMGDYGIRNKQQGDNRIESYYILRPDTPAEQSCQGYIKNQASPMQRGAFGFHVIKESKTIHIEYKGFCTEQRYQQDNACEAEQNEG